MSAGQSENGTDPASILNKTPVPYYGLIGGNIFFINRFKIFILFFTEGKDWWKKEYDFVKTRKKAPPFFFSSNWVLGLIISSLEENAVVT